MKQVTLWIAAAALLAAGTVFFFVWDTSWAWWLYGLTAVPITLLAGEKLRTDDLDVRHGGFMDGPWGPP